MRQYLNLFLLLSITENYKISKSKFINIVQRKETMIPMSEIKMEDFSYQQPLKSSETNSPFFIIRRTLPGKELFKIGEKWSQIQMAKYIAFVEHNFSKIEGKSLGKLWNLFREMASFIISRNFRQCKSYHQKLFKKYGNISNILKQLIKQNQNFPNLILQCRNEVKQYKFVKTSNTIFDSSFFHFAQIKTEVNLPNQIRLNSPQIFDRSFSKMSSYNKNNEKHNEWLECHKLFIQWIDKWNSLITEFKLIPPRNKTSKLI